MSSVQRAFAQKLSKHHAADVRRTVAGGHQYTHQIKSASISGCSSMISLNDLAEPLDYEDFVASHQSLIDRDPLRNVLDFPAVDVEVCQVPRKIRTVRYVVPEESFETLPPRVKACVKSYTSDWRVVEYRHRHYSSSVGTKPRLDEITARQEFEVDYQIQETDTESSTFVKTESEPPSGRQSVASLTSSSFHTDSTLTPRSSWASFDLRNSVSDPLLIELFERTAPDQIDQVNESRRKEDRHDALFQLFPNTIDETGAVEYRLPAAIPVEHHGQRVLVKCSNLKLDLDIEPLFATMALYDAKERKKVSENFYFDMNSDAIQRMLNDHVAFTDVSTKSRAAIFDVTYPHTDLFIVVKLEKVLQGDLNECVEPYLKDDKNRDKIKSNAVAMCERLGKYRQPFAWAAVSLWSVITGAIDRDGSSGDCSAGSNTNSLERKHSGTSLEQLRRRATDVGGSLTRRSSLERRSAEPEPTPDQIQTIVANFRPVTVSLFFKQESDRFKDDELYKLLQELKRPSLKKTKCIPGVVKLDVAPCPDNFTYALTPDLDRLEPYPDDKGRPCKELLEMSSQDILVPHYTFRNLLYVYPRELNFSNRAGSARNLTVRVQLMAAETAESALTNIFGKSSGPEFTNEAYTSVMYHNKSPAWCDEIKMKLPAILLDSHHLLFTFYHISCQKKVEQPTVDTPVGYTWLPLTKDGKLVTGEFLLPVMLEPPPSNYSYIPPDVYLPGTKWLDNHKGVFAVTVHGESSVHTFDKYLEQFLHTCDWLESGRIPPRIGESGIEAELRTSLNDLGLAKPQSLVKFLPLVLDFLLRLLVQPPYLNQMSNVSTVAFEAMCKIFQSISELADDLAVDQHNRVGLLTTYVHYQACIPHPLSSTTITTANAQCKKPGHASPDDEIRALSSSFDVNFKAQCRRLAHEELALQWVVSSGVAKDRAMANSWTLFDLIVKSMAEHLAYSNALHAPRKLRFTDQFAEDVVTLVHNVTTEIIARYSKDLRAAHALNCSVAFFIFDLLSLMDRGFTLGLVRTYCKQMNAKIISLPDAIALVDLKLDFIRIICSHEHFVALNLPFATPYTISSAPASPNPSIASSLSQTSFMSGLTPHERLNYAELSLDFRQQHFLVGLLLMDLTNVLDIQNPLLHAKVVDSLKNLLSCHDNDERYTGEECRARVAALYLPLLAIVMDSLPMLYHASLDWKDRGTDDYLTGINMTIALAIAGTRTLPTASFDAYQPSRKPSSLNAETTRNLLVCFLWVLKNIASDVSVQWLGELPANRLQTLLQVLHVCITCFEYKGKKEMKRRIQQNFRKTTDIKSKLEDVILGQGSARSELIQRRKERAAVSPSGEKLRWRKEQMAYRPTQEHGERAPEEIEADAHIEGNLATEAAFIVLDMLERVVHVVHAYDANQNIVCMVFKVLFHALARNQSTVVMEHMFATQRSMVYKFHGLLFDDESELCADLCLLLLRHCGSYLPGVRAQAAASLYLLMRQTFEIGNNFARVKMQVTMSLSSLVGTNTRFSEESLRRALKTILEYAEHDAHVQETTFPEQVRDLVFNLHMILSDTVKMKEFQEDPEMLLDLMYRIAKGYQNSPDLRITWLANMAQKHMERKNHSEAAMCLVHSAALVSEYLAMQESLAHLPEGAVSFEKITPNALYESAVSDDVLSPEQEGVCLGSHFTEAGLSGLLEHAASSFTTAGMYEVINDVYKILLPIAENNRDYKKLANIHNKLQEAFTRIDQLQGRRVFGTYFRVGFYGAKFGDLNQEEFVYKEPTLTKLPEIFSRLENFYAERFGDANVVIIKDSNAVDVNVLDPDKAYIQITYVEPYFEEYELRYNPTHFDRNFNIKRFVYATPFTTTGRAHGELHEQCKRKTMLTTARHFPYVKTRIQVVERKTVVLSPIEVAIEDIQKKISELAAATVQEPPDPKILQMVLQGCIGTTVNQGPVEMAQVFLPGVNYNRPWTSHQNKLRLCFKDFSKKCADALKKNKNLIGLDQRDYQKELERNYHVFTEKLHPLINVCPQVANATKVAPTRAI